LQPLLAQHDVETRIWKRHCRRAPELPVDAWILPSRVEHALIHIKAGQFAVSAAYFLNSQRDESGAAGNVQHAFAVLAIGVPNKIIGPLLHCADSEPVIQRRRVTA
jgi:hypothetical protein